MANRARWTSIKFTCPSKRIRVFLKFIRSKISQHYLRESHEWSDVSIEQVPVGWRGCHWNRYKYRTCQYTIIFYEWKRRVSSHVVSPARSHQLHSFTWFPLFHFTSIDCERNHNVEFNQKTNRKQCEWVENKVNRVQWEFVKRIKRLAHSSFS